MQTPGFPFIYKTLQYTKRTETFVLIFSLFSFGHSLKMAIRNVSQAHTHHSSEHHFSLKSHHHWCSRNAMYSTCSLYLSRNNIWQPFTRDKSFCSGMKWSPQQSFQNVSITLCEVLQMLPHFAAMPAYLKHKCNCFNFGVKNVIVGFLPSLRLHFKCKHCFILGRLAEGNWKKIEFLFELVAPKSGTCLSGKVYLCFFTFLFYCIYDSQLYRLWWEVKV